LEEHSDLDTLYRALFYTQEWFMPFYLTYVLSYVFELNVSFTNSAA